MKYKGWTFTEFPPNISKEEYNRVSINTLNKLRNIPSISVYIDYGKKKKEIHPGISDIDFIVIANNPSKSIKKKIFLDNADIKTRDVMYHNPLIISKNLAKRFGSIVGNQNYKWVHVCGQKITTSNPTKTSIDFRSVDDIIMHDLRYLYAAILKKNVRIREIIHKLGSLKFRSFYLMPKFRKQFKKQFDTHLKKVSQLRKNWFKNKMPNNLNSLIKLIYESIKLNEAALEFIANYISSKYTIKSKIPINYLADTERPILFKITENIFSEVERLYNKYRVIICIYPQELSFLLPEYAKQKGIISNHIRKRLYSKKSIIKPKYLKQARDRINFYNDQMDYCMSNDIEYGPLINFQLGYKPKELKLIIRKHLGKMRRYIQIRRAIDDSLSFDSLSVRK